MKKKANILICYNEPASYYDNYTGKEECTEPKIDLSETDIVKQIDAIKATLNKSFTSVETLPINGNAVSSLKEIANHTPDVIFNFVESIEGNASYESYIAGMFDIHQFYYTGSNALTLGNCLNKVRTKQILQSYGIKTPSYIIAHNQSTITKSKFNLRFPVISKLIREDASIGISELSVSHDLKSLNKRLKFLFENYKQDVLIEEYIPGREINAAILGDSVLPLSEITFGTLPKGLPPIVTYEAKWAPDSIYYNSTKPLCPVELKPELQKRIEETALRAFKIMGCRDYARVDIRLSKRETPYVIEVNPNPDISIDSGFVRSAQAAGINYKKLLKIITNFALERKKYDTQS